MTSIRTAGAPPAPLRLVALADAVMLADGWRRRLVALAAGAFGALALAPFDIGPALVVTLTLAVWLIDGAAEAGPRFATLRSAFAAGWWLGFGYFVAGFWWLSNAFLIDPQFAWALPFGVFGLPALLAIFVGAGFLLARLLWMPGAGRVLSLALALSLSDWARGHLLSGFPWNTFGMGLGSLLAPAQLAAIVGLDGLTLVTVLLFAAPATLVDGARGRLAWRPTAAAVLALAGLVGWGAARLSAPPVGVWPQVVVRIMQPGLRPDEKFSPQNKDAIVAHYIDLSSRIDAATGTKLSDVTMLVWPESAFPFILSRDPEELAKIGAALPEHTSLVTGAARQEDVPNARGGPDYSVYYNAIEVVAHGGTILDTYDKVHLVPFGEYLPASGLLRRLGLRNFVAVPGGFEPGFARHALAVPGLPSASPLICYEAIFPGEAMPAPRRGQARPAYLLNVTNDGWFGLSAGPAQHFAQARLRTIEQGLPMVRAAATGISAIVDPYGRILRELPLGAEGIIDGPLPRPVARPPFARFGEPLFYIAWLATLAALLVAKARAAARRR